VRPVVHYTMGGIHTDIDAQTPLPGLFAAGECACVSINGANRLGSNSLAEIVVFGARAGRGAAAFAKANPNRANSSKANPKPASAGAAAEAAQARLRELFEREGGGDSVSSLRKAMNDTMESGAGIYRTEQTLQETCGILADLRARYRKMPLQDRSNVFNTDLIQALELGCMLDVASAMAQSALQRKESRGSHQRLEYPDRDDANYLKHSMASYRGDAAPSISYRDVVITRSQPAERVYGGAAT
jgi:fumarate reductase flavoprotein subunit